MTVVAVTMMEQFHPCRGEWRDAVDQRWSSFLLHCGILPMYMPNNVHVSQRLIERFQPQGVLLTGGGTCHALSGVVSPRDETETMLLAWAEQSRRPVLGICRGMQVMLSRAGGTLKLLTSHIGPHLVHHRSTVRQVNSFHDYGFFTAPPGYHIDALAEDGVIEAASNPRVGHTALMWHPERNAHWEDSDVSLIRQIYGVAP